MSAIASPENRRIVALDVVRGAALFGVLIVNLITEFRVSLFLQFLSDVTSAAPGDVAVERFVHFFLESKAFALFSLLFGIGLAMQWERLSGTGRVDYLLSRRLLVLLGFGLLHLLFIWNGDILTEYAIAGFVVLPFLRLPAEQIAKAAAVSFAIYFGLAVFPQPLRLPDAATLQQHVELATQVYANAPYTAMLKFSWEELRLMLPLHLNVFPRTVALMLLGACIWKSGMLRRDSGDRRSIAKLAIVTTAMGLALTAVPERLTSGMLAPIVLAMGYGSLIYSMSTSVVLRPIAALGRMAFTNYILQSLVLGFVFFGYGLGQFGQMGASRAFVLGLIVYIAQAALSLAWLRHFRFGPLEWLWRELMYGQRVPNRAGQAPGA